MSEPESLNLWDRLFNRYRKTVNNRGSGKWARAYRGQAIPGTEYFREWVEYKITDRLTGSETIERRYLDEDYDA